MEASSHVNRVLAIAGGSLLTATLAGLVALEALRRTLPPSDAAYGLSLPRLLADPFVLTIFAGAVLAGASLGCAFGVLLLWRTRLSVSIPVVLIVTVGAAGASGFALGPLCAPIAFVAGLVTMSILQGGPRSRTPIPSRPRA